MIDLNEIVIVEDSLGTEARAHLFSKPNTHIKGSLNGLSIAEKSQLKNDARRARGANLTDAQVSYYDWIDSIQTRLKLSNADFALKFSDLLKDPFQTFKLYRRRSGVFPSAKTHHRLLELEASIQINSTTIPQVIYQPLKSGMFIKLVWDDSHKQFIANKSNLVILTQGEVYANTVERFRDSRSPNC